MNTHPCQQRSRGHSGSKLAEVLLGIGLAHWGGPVWSGEGHRIEHTQVSTRARLDQMEETEQHENNSIIFAVQTVWDGSAPVLCNSFPLPGNNSLLNQPCGLATRHVVCSTEKLVVALHHRGSHLCCVSVFQRTSTEDKQTGLERGGFNLFMLHMCIHCIK